MRHTLFTGLVLSILLLGGVFAEAAEYREGYLLVRFSETGITAQANTTRQAVVNAAGGGTIERMYSLIPGLGVVQLPAGTSVSTARSKFQATIGVKYAEPDFIVRKQAVPNDPMFPQMWGLRNTGQTGGMPGADIKAVPAWDVTTGSRDVIVAVIDTGVDYMHPDIAANMWVNTAELNGTPGVDDDGNGFIDDIYGYDFWDNNGDPMDGGFHGTHVAGTIGAVGNNAVGVTGVCWDVRLMAIRFLGPDGGFTSGAISSVEYATLMGAHITNNSWGGGGYSQALYDAIDASRAAGILFVAAAGNSAMDNDVFPHYPSNYQIDNVVSVMATDHNDQRAWFSNRGKTTVHLAAPGENILSTFPNNSYGAISGTSMAAPHVAGAAALLLAANPELKYLENKQILMTTADKLTSLKELSVSEGRLNLHSAVLAAGAGDMLPPRPDPMEWKVEPIAVGTHTIFMQAVTATDASGVEYYFECVNDTAFDSGWQASPIYHRGGLTSLVDYTFRVKARDKSENQNETQWSEAATASTPVVDMLPPHPSPAEWKALPRRLSNIRIGMETEKGHDEFGTQVTYFFECVEAVESYDPNGLPIYVDQERLDMLSQGPQTSPLAFVNGVSDGSLGSPSNYYTFRVQIIDHLGNVTEWSEEKTVVMRETKNTRHVPSASYPTIQSAINASNHTDRVVVHPGVHREINISFKGKRITVTSLAPEDPAIVASTIIDCEEPFPTYIRETRRAFLFQNRESRDSVLAGITIKNARAIDNSTVRRVYPYVPPFGWFYDPWYYQDGENAYGGAIYIGRKIPDPFSHNRTYPDILEYQPASPTIRNCVFVNCSAEGMYGSHGANATNVGNDQPGLPGVRGGHGGNAYGGAIYGVQGSKPLIRKCSFINCLAVGGDAGNGGNGSNGGGHSGGVDDADGWRGGDGGDAGHGGVGYGGAVYFEPNSVVELYDIMVSNCYVQVGEPGSGGDGADGSAAKGVGNGGHGGNGGIGGDLRAPTSSGGAVYFGENVQVTLEGSYFENNRVIAELSGDYSGGNGGNGGNHSGDEGTGTIGGSGGHGGPAYYIPEKVNQIGGATATGGTGGDAGGAGGRRGSGGNGGFRFGLPGAGLPNGINWTLGYQQTGIFPSNIYYMAYYWEDTGNIVNEPDDPNELQYFAYNWENVPYTTEQQARYITEEELPYYYQVDPFDPNSVIEVGTYIRTAEEYIRIFNAPFSPYYGILSYTEYYEPDMWVEEVWVPSDPNDPDNPDGEFEYVLVQFPSFFPVETHAEVIRPLTPTNPDEPIAGAIAGANFYGRNSVVRMKGSTFVNNSSFANHGGAELYARGADATFDNCRYENNQTLYATAAPTDYKFEGYGGAVFADQPVQMLFTGCEFVGNQGKAGGAIYCNFAPSEIVDPEAIDPRLELTDCTFTENKADYHFMYSYGGAVFAGNTLDPYEEYYFNYLREHRHSNYWDRIDFYAMYPDAYDEFTNFVVSIYNYYHGYANFDYAIGTDLWATDINVPYADPPITITAQTEADRIFYGLTTPRYQVSVTNSTFEGNLAPYGAGLYVDASIADVVNTTFIGNEGQTGVGLYAYANDLFVQNSIFDKNIGDGIPTQGTFSQQESSTVNTFGFGGGAFISNSDLTMLNNRFTANEVSGYAGAAYIDGPSIAGDLQVLVNTLFVENIAAKAGGALVATGYSDVDIANATFVDNVVTEYQDGVAGALLVHDSFVSVRNSIFWDNLATLGAQISVGDPLELAYLYDPDYIPMSTLWIYNSNVQGGEDDIFIDYNGWPWLIYEDTNIDADPLFITVVDPTDASERTFYLSQIDAQFDNSPSVDTGVGTVADLAALLGFEITTRTDHEVDTDPLDMGFHYDASLPVQEYILTAQVLVDYHLRGKLMLTHHSEPAVEVGKDIYVVSLPQSTQVRLTAIPEPNYRVRRWIGTDDDTSFENVNIVTMSGNRNVQVEFELAVPRQLLVPESYPTIEDAVQAARTGDTIILAPRVGQPYTIVNPEGINFGGRQLTLTSDDPTNPFVVANTVIDVQGSLYARKRAFTFNNGEDPNTVIEGITIRNAFWAGAMGLSGMLDTGPWPPVANAPPRALSGLDAFGTGYGGAMLCTEGSSPTIRNVIFENNTVAGGVGGSGYNGGVFNNDGQSGGHGGNGIGNGYGGAIAVINGSSPIITNCVFRNNRATGGWGGIGGNGGNATGNGRNSWGGNAGNGEGDGRGGAIYIEAGCNPLVTDNVFEGNIARLGYASSAGNYGTGQAYGQPWNWPDFARQGSVGSLTTYGGVAGGAIFYGEDADSVIHNSVFKNNEAYLPQPINYFAAEQELYDYTRGGAIYADPNVVLSIQECDFIGNLGGAIYASTGDRTVLEVNNCLFENNATYDPTLGKEGIQNLEAFIPGLMETPQQPAGAITIEPDVTTATVITNSRFVGNLSDGAGGAIQTKSDMTVQNSSFSVNNAILRGGAIYAYRYLPGTHLDTLVMNLLDCEFTHNSADELGGAIYVQNNILDVQSSQFVGNTSCSGGGLMAVESELTMAGGLFVANEATGLRRDYLTVYEEGLGGGLYLLYTPTAMVDTRILNNTARGVNAAGGGICITGGLTDILTYNLHNCLIAGNSSEANGGGLNIKGSAEPRLDNCTIADNTAGKLGGGMFVHWTSKATLNNSILFGNSPANVYEQSAGSVSMMSVMQSDPQFVAGPLGNYYLDPTGPAVNAGNITALQAQLDRYTTNPAVPVVFDTGMVDLGYHYNPDDVDKQFTLTAVVLDAQGQSRGTVTVTPTAPVPGLYYFGQIVEMTVNVQTDYVIAGWSGGTVDDTSLATTNKVLLTGNKDIVVTARQRQTYYVGGSTGLPTLQDGIDAALDGDQILIYPGTYVPAGFSAINLHSKNLRISSLNPDDMQIVRATVISSYQIGLVNATEETVIEGITLQSGRVNIQGGSPVLRNVVFRQSVYSGGTASYTLNCPEGPLDGGNGGSVLGGAVVVRESAPRFTHCFFEDNAVYGGNGQDGSNGCAAHPSGGDGGWPGRAYGGAVYVAFSSKPVFENCTFTGNQAIGGNGGNGGAGHQGAHGGRGGGFLWPKSIEQDWTYWTWWDGWEHGDTYQYYAGYFGRYDFDLWSKWFGWDRWNTWQEFLASPEYQNWFLPMPSQDAYEEYWKYSGYGGAVYVGYLSEAMFIDCTFEDNQTQGGLTGVGGANGTIPNRQLNLPNAGGAVYAAYDSKLVFENTQFVNNLADTSTVDMPLTYEVSFGGAVAYEYDSEVIFKNTDFQGNRATVGGAIFGRDSTVEIDSSNVFNNEAFLGAGLYLERGDALITDTVLEANKAKRPDVLVTLPDDDGDDDDDGDGDGDDDGDGDLVIPVAEPSTIGQGGGLFVDRTNLDLRHSVFITNRADISGGGLYTAGTVQTPLNVFNTLFARNTAGRDGAGASVNWDSRAVFTNCTFADNQATGYGTGELFFAGSGGGLNIAYDSIVDVLDSIFWGNNAAQGAQITASEGFEFAPRPSTLNIAYSNVQGFGSAGAIFRGQNCIVNAGDGMLGSQIPQDDPLFVAPDEVEEDDVQFQYYLDQANSPSVDAGSRLAAQAGLDQLTTSIFGARDAAEVDMGYHYPITLKVPCSFSDLVMNGRVDLADFAVIASAWLYHDILPCGPANDWCNGADLNFDRRVDIDDLLGFTACWLEEDVEAPFPDPSLWVIEPNAVPGTFTSIMMTALTARDAWRPDDHISYYFDCLEVSALSSGWLELPSYALTGLLPGFEYTFTVRARDVKFDVDPDDPAYVINVTAPSVERGVKPGQKVKPTPNPAEFVEGTPFVSGVGMLRMEAVPYNGPALPSGVWVEYRFEHAPPVPGGDSSPWQTSPIYVDSDLQIGQTYAYRVWMRFNTPYGAFEPGEPSEFVATLVTMPDIIPPEPNPAQLQVGYPFQGQVGGQWYHILEAVPATDNGGPEHVNVEYKFRGYTAAEGGSVFYESPWRNLNNAVGTFPDGRSQVGRPHEYWRLVGASGFQLFWTVQYRDMAAPPNVTEESPRTQLQNF